MDDDFSKYLTAASKKLADAQKSTLKNTNIRDEISCLENQISLVTAEVDTINIRVAHLRLNYKSIDNLLSQLDEISRRIESIHEKQKRLNHIATGSTFFTRENRIGTENNQVPGLESSCMRSIREACETISSYFSNEYHKNAGGDFDASERFITKDALWSKVENIANKFSPSEIHEALLLNIKDSTSNLKELGSNIDLKRDAENLKFMFETGKLKDVSIKPALVQTVQQLIEEGEVAHFQRFIESEKSKNEAWKAEKRLQELNNSINEAIKNNFPPEKGNKIRNMFSLEQEHASCVASQKYLRGELTNLKAEREERERSVSNLQKKYNRIQSFDNICRSKQKVIQELIKTNGSAKPRHRQQLDDIKTSTEQKILKMESELPHLCQQYHDFMEDEIQRYLNIPVQKLEAIRQVSDKRLLVSDMSIHRTSARYEQPGQEQVKKIAEKVNVPHYAPPEAVISAVLENKNEAHVSTKKIEDLRTDVCDLTNATSEILKIQQNLSRYHDEDVKSSLPSLKESKQRTADVMTECMKFRSTVQLWWDQPAQHVVPWVSEDGLSLSQYLERFSVQASLLKKMQMVN